MGNGARLSVPVLCVALIGCATVHADDIESWQGAPTVELQTHPLFSTVPKKVEPLADGSEMWTFSNCIAGRATETCNVVGNAMVCSGGQPTQACCYNQFLVRGARVAWYRTVGSCYTDCSVRPESRPCR
jgi:hypothetical protein